MLWPSALMARKTDQSSPPIRKAHSTIMEADKQTKLHCSVIRRVIREEMMGKGV